MCYEGEEGGSRVTREEVDTHSELSGGFLFENVMSMIPHDYRVIWLPSSLPMTGSSLPSLARAVRSVL